MGTEQRLTTIEENMELSSFRNLNSIIPTKSKNKKDKNNHPELVIGIDFGTSGIAYAYGFYENQKKIISSDLKDEDKNIKVPTEIILDNDLNNVLAFGNECAGYIVKYPKNSYQYFRNIKMNLYNKVYKIKSTNGVEANIEIIISKLLTKISDEAISNIERCNRKTFKKDEIKWVVTIPAIWEEKSKQIMINASRKAGLINQNTDISLFLALEPEVAGIFYFSDLFTKMSDDYQYRPFIICDIGAGTVDICCYRREITDKNEINDSPLIEEYPPIGGNYGGNYINEEFIKRLIIELFGEEKVEQLKNDIKNEKWKKFEHEIEKLKKLSSNNEPFNCELDCKLFKVKETKKKLDDYISEYNKKEHKFKYHLERNPDEKWKLKFPSQVFIDINKEIAKKIFIKLEEVYNNVKDPQIVLTGAGSKNNNIYHFILEYAQEKNLNFEIVITYEPEATVLNGAVLFGFQSNIIKMRKSKYTIGIRGAVDWDENLHKGKGMKKFNLIENKDKCINIFKKFITRNEYIGFDQIISKNFRACDKRLQIILYKSLKDDCTYIDEKDENNEFICKKFGSFDLDLEDDFDTNNKELRIDMKMGGTYIYAYAEYLKTGNNKEITQHFDEE